jgi:hypothetical protein
VVLHWRTRGAASSACGAIFLLYAAARLLSNDMQAVLYTTGSGSYPGRHDVRMSLTCCDVRVTHSGQMPTMYVTDRLALSVRVHMETPYVT